MIRRCGLWTDDTVRQKSNQNLPQQTDDFDK